MEHIQLFFFTVLADSSFLLAIYLFKLRQTTSVRHAGGKLVVANMFGSKQVIYATDVLSATLEIKLV